MKRKISVCILVFGLAILAAAAGRGGQPSVENHEQAEIATESEHMENMERTERMVEVSSDPVPYAYILRERNGWVVVYYADSDDIYMETGIMLSVLPDEIAAALSDGIGVKDETELFDFLENYSS